ncbi:MAG TPA: MFS transporter [Egibacteraceae bacterium]|nr:MFS transporter [Egibacteraceae bacterium]
MPRARRGLLTDPTFAVALAIAVVVALGFGVIVPVLPLFARAFGVGLFEVTLVVSVFAAARLVSNVYTGALTDRVGMRTSICWGAGVVAFSSLLISVAPNYAALLAFRGLGGFGSALFLNALLAFIVRAVASDQRGRAVGLLQGAFLFGISLGPSVGGLLAEPLGLRWPFVIYAVFCGASGVVAYLFLPRADELPGAVDPPAVVGPEGGLSGSPRGFATIWGAARQLCTDRAFVAALVMMAASRWASTGLRFSLVPVFGAEQIGAGPFLVGLALTVAALTQLAVLWPAGKIADTLGRRRLAVPAYLAFAAVAATFGLAGTVPVFFAVMALYGMGTGLTAVTPPAIVGDVVPDGRTGLAMGVLNTAGDLGIVLGPLLSGLLADAAGYGWAFGVSAALLLVAALAAAGMPETLRSGAPTEA